MRRRTESGTVTPVVEESVVLRVGGGEGEGVQVVRSFNRRRLWKATNAAAASGGGGGGSEGGGGVVGIALLGVSKNER